MCPACIQVRIVLYRIPGRSLVLEILALVTNSRGLCMELNQCLSYSCNLTVAYM